MQVIPLLSELSDDRFVSMPADEKWLADEKWQTAKPFAI